MAYGDYDNNAQFFNPEADSDLNVQDYRYRNRQQRPWHQGTPQQQAPEEQKPPFTPPDVSPTPQQPAQQQLSREQIRDMWMARGGGQTPQDLANFIQQHGGGRGTVINPKSGVVRWDWGGGKVEDLDMGIGFGTGAGTAGWGANRGMLGAAGPGAGGVAGAPGAGDVAGIPGGLSGPLSGRSNQLYEMLLKRAQQGLAVGREDPAVRAQADAYSAQEERARRGFLGDIAERGGPYGTGAQLGQERMSAERMGQRVGGFEAQLVGREIQARRDEIAQSLESMRGMLSTEQQLAMQRELAQLDDAARRYGIDVGAQTAAQQTGLGYSELDWRMSPYNPANLPK